MTCSALAVSLVVGPIARGSDGAPLWAIAIALVIVMLALYMLFGARRLPFRGSGLPDPKRGEDPEPPPPGA